MVLANSAGTRVYNLADPTRIIDFELFLQDMESISPV